MDKNFKLISIIPISIILYYALSWSFLRETYNEIYFYGINPLFWLLITFISVFLIFNSKGYIFKHKKIIISIAIMASLVYILFYFGFGIISGFANNPYDNTLVGFIFNLYSIGLIIVLKEITRSSLINSPKIYDKKIFGIILIIVFCIADINFLSLSKHIHDVSGILKFTASTLFPLIITNSLFIYTAKKAGPLPAIIFRLAMIVPLWISSVLPDHQWLMYALIDSLIPFLTYLTLDYIINLRDTKFSRRILEQSNPKYWIPTFILIVVLLFFFLGVAPVYPISIVTNSMYPEINVGDVTIVKKVSISDVELGDIVQYQQKGYTVIHRVVEINNDNKTPYAITKGDNNMNNDSVYVTDLNIKGKIVLIIPKLGLPSYWLRKVFNNINEEFASDN